MRCAAALLVLMTMLPSAYSAQVFNRARVSVCILQGGSIEVSWSASSQIVGENAESVTSLEFSGELRSFGTLSGCQLLDGVSLDTCRRSVSDPGKGVYFCGGAFASLCGDHYRASSLGFSRPAKPSNGRRWSGCTVGDCSAEPCPASDFLRETLRGLPACF